MNASRPRSGKTELLPDLSRRRPRHAPLQTRSGLGPHVDFHLADLLDRALETVAVLELAYASRRPRGDEVARTQREHAGEEPDVLAHAADHVAGVRLHLGLAVLLDAHGEVLRIGDLVARDDPRPEPGERVEALADVARVLPPATPGIALAEIPADGVAEDVIERVRLAHAARGRPD